MQIVPRNRYLLVELLEDEKKKEEPTILLPEDYKPVDQPFVTARVKDVSPSCTLVVSRGDIVLLNKSMVEKVDIQKNLFSLILENHVLGVVKG
jgi:co-chaperonin GroES (HSP10)|tara:strand:- start:1799 stop:2077 length:279 start_codon:yes stop_codon:yes gene_type:complete